MFVPSASPTCCSCSTPAEGIRCCRPLATGRCRLRATRLSRPCSRPFACLNASSFAQRTRTQAVVPVALRCLRSPKSSPRRSAPDLVESKRRTLQRKLCRSGAHLARDQRATAASTARLQQPQLVFFQRGPGLPLAIPVPYGQVRTARGAVHNDELRPRTCDPRRLALIDSDRTRLAPTSSSRSPCLPCSL